MPGIGHLQFTSKDPQGLKTEQNILERRWALVFGNSGKLKLELQLNGSAVSSGVVTEELEIGLGLHLQLLNNRGQGNPTKIFWDNRKWVEGIAG